jgi:TM2 domain-containing membrane protein YozV
MTNYPPPYGQQPQPPQGPYGQPPYGQPPMPYGQPGAVAMPPQSNGWSVAALVTGLVGFCLPGLGGLLAVLFGFLGIKRSGVTHTGKGMSIAGLLLGLLSVGLWLLFGSAIWAMIQGTEANRVIARQFLNDLAAGNLTNAAAAVDSSVIDQDDLKKLSDIVKANGAITDITTVSMKAQTDPATTEVFLGGGITFQNGQAKAYEMRQVKKGDKWVIMYVKIE